MVLFVCFGLPGAYLMTRSALAMLGQHGAYGARGVGISWPALVAGFLLGAYLLLVGLGKATKFLYLLCFVPLPFIMALTVYLDDLGSWWVWVTHPTIFLWPVATYAWCRAHYQKRGRGAGEAREEQSTGRVTTA
jgi:hypothetical protein